MWGPFRVRMKRHAPHLDDKAQRVLHSSQYLFKTLQLLFDNVLITLIFAQHKFLCLLCESALLENRRNIGYEHCLNRLKVPGLLLKLSITFEINELRRRLMKATIRVAVRLTPKEFEVNAPAHVQLINHPRHHVAEMLQLLDGRALQIRACDPETSQQPAILQAHDFRRDHM